MAKNREAERSTDAGEVTSVWRTAKIDPPDPLKAGVRTTVAGDTATVTFDRLLVSLDLKTKSRYASRVCGLRVPLTLAPYTTLVGVVNYLRGGVALEAGCRASMVLSGAGTATSFAFQHEGGDAIEDHELFREFFVPFNLSPKAEDAGKPVDLSHYDLTIFLSVWRPSADATAQLDIGAIDLAVWTQKIGEPLDE